MLPALGRWGWCQALLWGASAFGTALASKDMQVQDEEPVELPTFQHKDKTIRYPATSKPLPCSVTGTPHITAFFDGGAAKQLGTGGFIIFGSDGGCIAAQANFYGEEAATNNRAEIRALQDLMAWLVEHRVKLKERAVVIYGDSQLIVNFCNRRAKPSVGDLYAAMQEIHRLR